MYVADGELTARAEPTSRELAEGIFRSSLDALLDACWLLAAARDASGSIHDFRVVYANDAACEDIPREAQVGRLVGELWPRFRERLAADYIAVVETGTPLRRQDFVHEYTWEGQTRGGVFDLQVSRIGGGLLATWRDVTARFRAEAELKESEFRLRIARQAADLGIHDYDVRSGRIVWDERVRALWGVGEGEEITYQLFLEGLHPQDRAATEEAVRRALDPDGDRLYRAEYRVTPLRGGGTERWILATGHVIFEGREPVRLVGTVQDVTDRRRAVEALRQSEARARRLWESGLVGILYWDLRGEIIDANDTFLAMVGYGRDELLAGRLSRRALTPPEWDEVDRRAIAQIHERGLCDHFQKQYLRRDGSRVDVLLGAAAFLATPRGASPWSCTSPSATGRSRSASAWLPC